MGLFKRKIKNTFDIARETGIDEKKIKELRDGERHIEGETMDKVLKSINRDDYEREIEKLNIFDWYKNTDLIALRKKFGYEVQSHLSRDIKVDNGELCRFENHKFNKINNFIIKMYDFYHNDFNRRTEKEIEKTMNIKPKTKINATSEEKEKIMEWYRNTDIKSLRGGLSQTQLSKLSGVPQTVICVIEKKKFEEKRNKTSFASLKRLYEYYNNNNFANDNQILEWYRKTDLTGLRGNTSQKRFAREVGIAQSSMCDIENHKYKKMGENIRKVYTYCQKKGLVDTSAQEEKDPIYEWYMSIDDLKQYRRDFGYSLNKMMAMLNTSYDQIRDFESHKYKSATPIVRKFYNFYMDESNRQPAVEWKDDNKENETQLVVDNENNAITTDIYTNNGEEPLEYTIKMPNEHITTEPISVPYCQVIDESADLKRKIEVQEIELKMKDDEIANLKRQIMLYEKLIERLP